MAKRVSEGRGGGIGNDGPTGGGGRAGGQSGLAGDQTQEKKNAWKNFKSPLSREKIKVKLSWGSGRTDPSGKMRGNSTLKGERDGLGGPAAVGGGRPEGEYGLSSSSNGMSFIEGKWRSGRGALYSFLL